MRIAVAGLITASFLTFAVLAAPAAARSGDSAQGPFIGAGTGPHRLHFDSDDRAAVDVAREDEIGGQLRVGVVEGNRRVYGQWSVIRPADYLVSSLTANIDYLWHAGGPVTLFGGVGGGAITLSWDGDNSFDTMAAVSAQAGVILSVTRRMELELGVRQLFTRLRTDPRGPGGNSVDVDLDRLGVATAGVNVRF